MQQIIVFVLLSLLLCVHLLIAMRRAYTRELAGFQKKQDELSGLSANLVALKNGDSALLESAQDTIALYDITKEICKTLDEDKVFGIFRELINRYIEVRDCKFIKDEAELLAYPQYLVLPLKLNHHTMGYLIADGLVKDDSEKFHILSQQFMLAIKRALLYRKVQELAIKDGLTAVSSRRHFMDRLNEELERSGKFKYNFALLMVDIDHFKSYNDHYGHLVGDAILKDVGSTIRETIRQIDLVGRYGGEEFVLVLAETDRAGGMLAAERIRQKIQAKKIRVYDEYVEVTISAGLAVFPGDAKEAQALIENADEALYKAKESGRNRVCAYQK